ncbi:FecCD family ABC transporter permease [Sulfobacillus harzensis]|uniref:Iron ABC transporter permease n=1 Tax=Sulfobacillus harzensis TaxID=2729629 RepID=A0A7Y0L163_9FIRM|nr:iron ABC transporter permease [Sulfobacillus harzensis]NMP21340.1 iron ABC transporter permease [Sulfobacillus harzensis]
MAHRERSTLNFIAALAALVVVLVLGVMHGPTPIPMHTILARLVHPNRTTTSIIIWDIRLPEAAAAALVGGSLAVAGAVMQALLKNPLADPYIVGASAGASLGATLAQELAPLAGLMAPGAFVGALAAVLLSYLLSRGRGTTSMLTLILAGYAIGVILASVTTFLMLLNRQNLGTIFAWEVGGINGVTWVQVGISALLMLLSLLVVWPFAGDMNALLLGEEQAHHLGVPVRRVQLILLTAASLMTAAAVYISGLIGFVGLVIPHIVRRLNGPNHRQLLPLAFLMGAAFLGLADLVAQSIPVIGPIPVGLVTAFLGGPYFLYLLVKHNRKGGWTA